MHDEPVEYIKAGTKYDRGSGETIEDWSKPVVALSARALVEPAHAGEPDSTYRNAAIVGFRLYHQKEVEVDRSWRARVRGYTLGMEGVPAVWRSPWTGSAGTVVETRLMQG